MDAKNSQGQLPKQAAPAIKLSDLLPRQNVTGGKGPAKVTFGVVRPPPKR